MGHAIKKPDAARKKYDFYSTPEKACEYLVRRIVRDTPTKGLSVIEPCCGDGQFMDALLSTSKAHHIRGIDIQQELVDSTNQRFSEWARVTAEQGDFLRLDPADLECDLIITNPPFSLGLEFLQHSLLCAPVVGLLLPLNFLASVTRYQKLWSADTKLQDIHILPSRLKFGGAKGSAMQDYAFYTFNQYYAGHPQTTWANPSDYKD